jgi:predicted O-methyltransferase YrrM
MFSNADTVVPFNQLGLVGRPYKPTFAFNGDFINDHHRFYATCPVNGICIDIGIVGWLQQADALKLYEMAYFAKGDILELGCHKGLSTSILSQANYDTGRKKRIITNDLSGDCIQHTRKTLTDRNLADGVDFQQGDSAQVCRQLIRQRRRFDFVFIDHSHDYVPVLEVCQELKALVNPGGLCLFHDYNDSRNRAPDDQDYGNDKYGVYQGVDHGLARGAFEFYGCFGCTGLFRARGGQQVAIPA